MHRLIPSRYSERQTVLAEVVDDDAMLEDVILLDGATNDRIQGEQHGLIGISTYELVYGIPTRTSSMRRSRIPANLGHASTIKRAVLGRGHLKKGKFMYASAPGDRQRVAGESPVQ
jgi:hypothetical protein